MIRVSIRVFTRDYHQRDRSHVCLHEATVGAIIGDRSLRRSLRVKKGKGSPHSITERRVLELIPVLCRQPVGDVSHKPGGRLPLLSARPAVTLATLKRAASSFAAC